MRIKYAITLVLLTLLLSACTPQNNEPDKSETPTQEPQETVAIDSTTPEKTDPIQTDLSYFGQYQMSDDGISAITSANDIDKDYQFESDQFQNSKEFTTQGWVELEQKYIALWDKELNAVYQQLLQKLNEGEQKKLRASQNGWLQFHLSESEFVTEAWDDLGLGSQGRVQLLLSEKNRIRTRTLELMEYTYMLNGDVDFLYKSTRK